MTSPNATSWCSATTADDNGTIHYGNAETVAEIRIQQLAAVAVAVSFRDCASFRTKSLLTWVLPTTTRIAYISHLSFDAH